jgi:hypothetical protein
VLAGGEGGFGGRSGRGLLRGGNSTFGIDPRAVYAFFRMLLWFMCFITSSFEPDCVDDVTGCGSVTGLRLD